MKQFLKFLNRQIPFHCKLLTLTLVSTRTTELFAGWLHSTDIKLMKSSRFSPTINDWQFSPFCVLHFGKSLTYRRPDYFALLWLNCGHIKMWERWSHKHDVEVPKIRTSSTSRWAKKLGSSFFGLRSSFCRLGGLFYKTKTPVNFTSVCTEERFGLVF